LSTSKPNFFNPLFTKPAEVKVPKVAFLADKKFTYIEKQNYST